MNLIPFQHGEVALKEAFWLNGEPYFTRMAIREYLVESRQPKALQYKIAVAHLVYAFMKGEIIMPRPQVNVRKPGMVQTEANK